MLARRHGHPLTVVLPDNVTQERRQLLTLYGAEIIESPGALGSNGAIALARRLAAEDDRYVMADQYANAANPRAHYETTGPGDPGRLPGGGRLRRRAGHRRDAHGRRPPAARGQPGRAPHRRRAAARGAGAGPALPGRRVRAGDPGHGDARRPLPGLEHATPSGACGRCWSGRGSWAASRRARSSWRRAAWPRRWSAARSCCCLPTAAGSTCRTACGRATWPSSRPTRRRATGGEPGGVTGRRPPAGDPAGRTRGLVAGGACPTRRAASWPGRAARSTAAPRPPSTACATRPPRRSSTRSTRSSSSR